MSIKTEIAKYGSGVGYIYLTDVNDVLVRVFGNDPAGRNIAEREMLVSSVLTSNISATSVVEVTAAGGTITNLSYNGVSVFDVTTPITGATTDDLAANLAIAINSHLSVPEYTAVSSGSFVTVYLDSSEGDSLNGQVAGISVTGAATMTATNLDGGSYASGAVDSQIGYKMYLNTDSSASATSLVGATDVTSAVLRTSAASPYSVRESEIVSGSLSVDRDGSVTVVNVQTEGAVAADDLTSIDAGIFADGDTLIIRAKEAAKVTTVKEGGNIELSNNTDFVTGAKDFAIVFQYSISDNKWYEINRSPGNDLTVATLRSNNIAIPVQGVEISSINLSGGTTVITAGTDKGYWALVNSGTLTGNVTYSLAAGIVEGDTITVRMSGGIVLSGNNFDIGGVSLTSEQASLGVVVKNVWEGSSWIPTVVPFANGITYVTSSDLALKEDDLGNPGADGQILSSTTGGTRSWVSNNTDVILGNSVATSTNTAGVETTLRTITIPAATLSTNASLIEVNFHGTFNANANTKNLRMYLNGTLVAENLVTTAPNGVDFSGKMFVYRSASTVAKCSGEIVIAGAVNEMQRVQIGLLTILQSQERV
jgi:hypothetical protein